MDIGNPLHPAAGDHRNTHRAGKIDRCLDICALQHAVASHIGEQQCRNTGIFKPAGHIDHLHRRHIGPTLRRDHAVLCINGDNDAARKITCRRAHQIRVFQRGCANHNAGYAQIEPALNPSPVADSAAQLHMAGELRHDGPHRIAIHRCACERSVEIDDVQILCTLPGKDHRLRGRIIAVHCGAFHIALGQAHDLAGFQVDCGEDDQRHAIILKVATPKTFPAMPTRNAGFFPGETARPAYCRAR